MGGRSMGGRMCSMVAAGVDGLPAPGNLRGLVLDLVPAPSAGPAGEAARRSPSGDPRCRRCSSPAPTTRSASPTSSPTGRRRCRPRPRSPTSGWRARATTSSAATTGSRTRSARSWRGWHRHGHGVLGVERLELEVGGLRERGQHDRHHDDLAEGDDADHAAVAEAGVAQRPRPTGSRSPRRAAPPRSAARPRGRGCRSGTARRGRRRAPGRRCRRRTRRRRPPATSRAPPTMNDSTISTVAIGIATAIKWRRPRMSASRPPTTRPSAAGVAVVSVNDAIRRGVEPAHLAEVAVLEEARRRHEEVQAGRHRRERCEAAPVERRVDDVRALVAHGLGQSPRDVDGDDQPDQRDEVDEAPAPVADVGKRQAPSRRCRRRARSPSPSR